MMRMNLQTENGTSLAQPSAAQLADALDALGTRDNGFAILESADEHYLQTTGKRESGYVVEYREGSEQSHHQSVRTDIPHAQMVRVFQAYLAGEPWKQQLEWAAGFGPDATSGAALWTFLRPVLLALVVGLVVVAMVIQS